MKFLKCLSANRASIEFGIWHTVVIQKLNLPYEKQTYALLLQSPINHFLYFKMSTASGIGI